METIYLLVPMSAILVLAILGLFAWAVNSGQFDDLDQEAGAILDQPDPVLDADQGPLTPFVEQSKSSSNRQFHGD